MARLAVWLAIVSLALPSINPGRCECRSGRVDMRRPACCRKPVPEKLPVCRGCDCCCCAQPTTVRSPRSDDVGADGELTCNCTKLRFGELDCRNVARRDPASDDVRAVVAVWRAAGPFVPIPSRHTDMCDVPAARGHGPPAHVWHCVWLI